MFEHRLKILLAMLGFALAILVVRLIDMQVVHAHMYELQAERALLLRPKVIPSVRGRILDRTGRLLVSDEPCWDIKVDYGVIAMDPDPAKAKSRYVKAMTGRLRRTNAYGKGLTEDEVFERFRTEVDRMWIDLESFFGGGIEELFEKRKSICSRVQAIRKDVARRRGFEDDVREERSRHALVEGLNDQQQVAARAAFSDYPWVSVEHSTERVYRCRAPLAHVIGRVVPVTAEHIEEDVFADDELRCLNGTDRIGGAGVEYAAEALLRGSRGAFHGTRTGEVLRSTPPVPGGDVHLTIRSDLQTRLFEMFGEQIATLPYSLSGSIVVLDVKTRDCLAMISYPSYDPQSFSEDYDKWRADTQRNPLAFRAVARHYAPGSIVKPLVCLAGLFSGQLTPTTTFTCEGAMYPENPSHWRCWAAAGTSARQHHGTLVAAQAIKYSCNIFMYHTGQLLGPDTLTRYFGMFGLGSPSGTMLREEVSGINPTSNFMASIGRSHSKGSALHYAIGQAEVSVTPVQAANLMATYATGEFRHVALVRELSDPAVWELPGSPAHWQIARQGMYGVVNDADGTAYKQARISAETGYVLLGKTGSAEAPPAPVSYRIPYEDLSGTEQTVIIRASTSKDAIDDLLAEHPDATFDPRGIEVAERWPAEAPANGRQHSHAWFVAYLQPADANGLPRWNESPRLAFSVMVEYGGSGGRVSGVIAKKVAETLLEVLGPDLNPDAPVAARGTRSMAEVDAEGGS